MQSINYLKNSNASLKYANKKISQKYQETKKTNQALQKENSILRSRNKLCYQALEQKTGNPEDIKLLELLCTKLGFETVDKCYWHYKNQL